MAEKTEKFFVCDCCGKERIEPVRGNDRGPTRYTMHLTEDFGVAGGQITWKDLCGYCNSKLGRFVNDIRAFQKDARIDRLNSQQGETT